MQDSGERDAPAFRDGKQLLEDFEILGVGDAAAGLG